MPLFLLAKYWRVGALALVAASVFSYWIYLKHEISSARNAATELQAKLDACQAANLMLDGKIKDQNAAIKRADAQAKAEVAEASSDARIKVFDARQQTAALLHTLHLTKVPRTCTEAIKHANVHARELSQW